MRRIPPSLLVLIAAAEGWLPIHVAPIVLPSQRHCRRRPPPALASNIDDRTDTGDGDGDGEEIIPPDLADNVRSIAERLWGGAASLEAVIAPGDGRGGPIARGYEGDDGPNMHPRQGELSLPASVPYSRRYSYFLRQSANGDPRAQHSVGLLLWNGFAANSEVDAAIDPDASARWHAAAAVQGNVDALAVLGGCLRTGTGVGKCKDVPLGLRCIEYAAEICNPSGVNKKAAMMESNDDFLGAFRLYRSCYEDDTKRTNALLLFNLGYCLIHGGVGIDDINGMDGEQLWKDAVARAPEEGSEEAAWFLYERYASKKDEANARKCLDVAVELGHQDAMLERREC